MTALDIDETTDDDHVRLTLAGDIDVSNADELLLCIYSQVSRPEINRVTADLAGLAFVDSSGLRTLVYCRRQADALGKTFRIQGHHGVIAEIIGIIGLTEILTDPDYKPSGH